MFMAMLPHDLASTARLAFQITGNLGNFLSHDKQLQSLQVVESRKNATLNCLITMTLVYLSGKFP